MTRLLPLAPARAGKSVEPFRAAIRGFAITAAFVALVASPSAQEAPIQAPADQTLRRLSIEDLSRIDVTSASKHAEPVSEAAAAISVITNEDLRRAGITELPEALRLRNADPDKSA